MFQASKTVLSFSRFSGNIFRNYSAMLSTFETLKVTSPQEFVYHVELNRPDKLNAMNRTMWVEIGKCFNELAGDSGCRSIVLSAAGKFLIHFHHLI